MKLKKKIDDRQWVVLEENYPYALRLTEQEAISIANMLNTNQTALHYKPFYDAYYEYIEYYSEAEKEQITRLIP